jgi:hypothetical protein
MGRYSASSSLNRSRALPAEVPDQLKKPEEHSRDRRLQLETDTYLNATTQLLHELNNSCTSGAPNYFA